jgi:hypothetical protein
VLIRRGVQDPRSQGEYASNFTHRLRQLRRIGERAMPPPTPAPNAAGTAADRTVAGSVPPAVLAHVADFTAYV